MKTKKTKQWKELVEQMEKGKNFKDVVPEGRALKVKPRPMGPTSSRQAKALRRS